MANRKIIITRDETSGVTSPQPDEFAKLKAVRTGTAPGTFTPEFDTRTSTIPNEGAMLAHPMWWEHDVAVAKIGVYVSVVGTTGALLRAGLYSDSSGRPGSLLVDGGTVSAESTGVKEWATNMAPSASRVWFVVVAQGGAGTRPTLAYGSGSLPGIRQSGSTSGHYNLNCCGFSNGDGLTTGALPASWANFFSLGSVPIINGYSA